MIVFGLSVGASLSVCLGVQSPDGNQYDTDLSITHMDISFKADFQSNNVHTMVKASVENFSDSTVDTAEFFVCSGENDQDLSADVKYIYFLDEIGKKDLKYSVRSIEKRRYKRIYLVSFERPIRPGEKFELEFEYAMKGKPDHSSSPIWQSKDGVKELFLRGDFRWCPSLFVESKKDMFPRLYRPSWTLCIEYPAGYVAVADGELVSRREAGGVVKEEWKSVMNGYAQVFISKYEVERRTVGGLTLEVYIRHKELSKKASEKVADYANIFSLYVELYGHPGLSIYRIVETARFEGGGIGLDTGQVISMGSLEDISVVTHEMAHTWWGSLVPSYGEGSKFLVEAMAEFSSAYAMSHLGTEVDGESRFLYRRRRLFCFHIGIANRPKLYPLIQQEGYDAGRITSANYAKGPLVVNQIRLMLGDEVFFKCLKTFVAKYKDKTVNIYDFIDTINRVSGRDMTSNLKNLLWSAGYPSYRLVGFDSEKESGGYRTKVRIQNEGEYGLSCPLLLKMRGGEKREVFKVEGKDEREFIFKTDEKVIAAVIDPDLMAFQYHPQQRARLWMPLQPQPDRNWHRYGKSYMYYLLGDYQKAIDTITEYFYYRRQQKKAKSIRDVVENSVRCTPYLFMRGVYYLAMDDREHAEEDIKTAFPFMLGVLAKPTRVEYFHWVGAIPEKDMDQYLELLKLIAGRDFFFETGLDEEAKKRKVEEWKQWWEREGKHQKLDLKPLKEQFEAHRADRAVSIKGEKKRMGYCFDVAFDETRNKLYVAAGKGATHVFSARDGDLQFVTTMRDEGYHRNLKIAGDRLFLADFLRGLVIYDISGEVPVETWREEGVGMGIHVEGRYAYLAWQKRGLAIFDISDPDSPKMIGQCGALDNAWDVWVNDRYAYVADFHKGIATIDVSDPAKPKKIRMTTWDKKKPMAEIIRGEGNALFVGAGKHGMVVLDLIDPACPRVSTIFHPSDGSYGEGLCVRDGLVYLANGHEGYRHENGLIVVDARKLDSVRQLGRCSFLDWVEGVCVSGSYAFVANTGSGVRSVNIADPTRPFLWDSFGPIGDPYYDSHVDTSIGEAEKSQLEEFATSKKEILEGKEFRDRSTSLRSLLTMIWALKSNDFNLYSQVNPSDAAYIIPEEFDKASKELLKKWETAEVARISPPDPQADEAALCAIYVRRTEGSFPLQWEAHVFQGQDGIWKKLYHMETHGPVWRMELSRADADEPKEEGFVRLFPNDGVPEGWLVRSWSDVSKPVESAVKWTVKDEILNGSARGTWLISKRQYSNFILKFDFKLDTHGNSGCALRAPLSGDPAFDGMELQMADYRYNTSAKDSELTGGIYRAIAPRKQVYKPTKWNNYVVALKGSHLHVTLNSVIIQDLNLNEQDQVVLRHNGQPAPAVKNRPQKGHIGFQELSRGGDHVQIRNARIKVLDKPSESEPK